MSTVKLYVGCKYVLLWNVIVEFPFTSHKLLLYNRVAMQTEICIVNFNHVHVWWVMIVEHLKLVILGDLERWFI